MVAIYLLLIFFGLIGLCIGSTAWAEGESSTKTRALGVVGLLMFGIGVVSIVVFL